MRFFYLATSLLYLLSQPVLANSMTECEMIIRQGNESMAYKHCLPAAKEGNPKAQVLVGIALMNGVGVFQDPQAAAGWFRLAADQKYPTGMYYLAMTKISGLGSTQDEAGGMALMRKAAEAGEPSAKDFLTQIGEALTVEKPKKKRMPWDCTGVGCGKPVDGMPK